MPSLKLTFSYYFSSLHLASGLANQHGTKEDTVFVTTPQVIWISGDAVQAKKCSSCFSITNAESIIPPESRRLKAVCSCLPDIFISTSLQDHILHSKRDPLFELVNLNLKPSKCMFGRKEVEYFRHLITFKALQTNYHLWPDLEKPTFCKFHQNYIMYNV